MAAYLVTGGAGFIGSNYVYRLLRRGHSVTILDNLSRAGAPLNLAWLEGTFGRGAFRFERGDLRDAALVERCARQTDVIVHLGGQVAVTKSMSDPREDFEANAIGTFNVLEAARRAERDPIVIYASTNKVYGGMQSTPVVEEATRWRYKDLEHGCPESQPLDFHSPYGCSKGTGDQYARDYARMFGLRTVVFRQSCVYGPRQFGSDDQGWISWMMLAAVTGAPITIYGDGKQVRDVLHVEDLMDAYDAAIERIDVARGKAYNVGGGSPNRLAVWAEFGPMLERLVGRPIPVSWAPWRAGDQRVFHADIRRAVQDLGWEPRIGLDRGLQELFDWVQAHGHLIGELAAAPGT
ncbi:MAG TPA: NAD-dependent epimerase/dehydratase family protein [Vicinamibacterales bacterium]